MSKSKNRRQGNQSEMLKAEPILLETFFFTTYLPGLTAMFDILSFGSTCHKRCLLI